MRLPRRAAECVKALPAGFPSPADDYLDGLDGDLVVVDRGVGWKLRAVHRSPRCTLAA